MKSIQDIQIVESLSSGQRGVFSKGDLQRALTERHPAAFVRRVNALINNGALKRFIRGWYLAGLFDIKVLSQRIAPESYISMETVLSEAMIVGVSPDRSITAVKPGRTREYEACGIRITHLGIKRNLLFGFNPIGPVRQADPEKSVLDTLYFHLRGRRYPFDIYSDMDVSSLDSHKVAQYLKSYENPKFVAFAKGVIGL